MGNKFYATQKIKGRDTKEILCFENKKERDGYCKNNDYSNKIQAPKNLTAEEIWDNHPLVYPTGSKYWFEIEVENDNTRN